MALELKIYLWQKMKLDKPQNVAKAIIEKIVPCLVPKVTSTTIVIDPHGDFSCTNQEKYYGGCVFGWYMWNYHHHKTIKIEVGVAKA
jgi:hypothetical protein